MINLLHYEQWSDKQKYFYVNNYQTAKIKLDESYSW